MSKNLKLPKYPDGTKGTVVQAYTYTDDNGNVVTSYSKRRDKPKPVESKEVPRYEPIIYGHNFGQMENKPKYGMGVQQLYVPPAGANADVADSTLGGMGAGYQIGSSFGPYGGMVGAGIGAIGGLAMGIENKANADFQNKLATEQNSYMNKQKAAYGGDVQWQQKIYADGSAGLRLTKPIEVEGNEIILRREGEKFKIVQDFINGKSHKEGGEDTIAEEGDIIIPKNKRKKALDLIDNQDWMQLDALVSHLPSDTGMGSEKPYKKGTKSLKLPKYPNGVEAITSRGMGIDGDNYGGLTRDQYLAGYGNSMPAETFIGSGPTFNPMDASPAPIQGNNVQEGVGNFVNGLPTVYNTIQGIFGTPDKVNPNYVNPDLLTYRDMSNPLRLKSLQARNAGIKTSRNMSGGNANVFNNAAKAQNNADVYRQMDINNAEAQRQMQVEQYNNQLTNNAKFYNAQELNRVTDLNTKAVANKRQYLEAGLTGASGLSQLRMQKNYMKNRDAKADEIDAAKIGMLPQIYPAIQHPNYAHMYEDILNIYKKK